MPHTSSEESSSQDEKIRVLKELSQVFQKIKALERERNNTIFNKKSEFRPFYSELEDMNLKFEEQRKEEMCKMRKDLDRLRSIVRQFRNTVVQMRANIPGIRRDTASHDQGAFSPNGASVSVEKLKEKVEEIDNSLNSFKSSNRENYELFVHAEKLLHHELAALERRIEAWDVQNQQSSSASVAQSRNSGASSSGHLSSTGSSKVKIYNMTSELSSTKPPAVIEFEKYVEKHEAWDVQNQQSSSASVAQSRNSGASSSGHLSSTGSSKVKIYNMTSELSSTKPPAVIEFEKYVEKHGGEKGGWDEYDHITFVKYYTLLFKQSSASEDVSKRRLIERISLELPYKSVEDITNHVEWYQQFLDLQDKKKSAIAVWRKQKDSDRLKAQAANLTEDDSQITEDSSGVELDEEDLQKLEEKREMIKLWKVRKLEEERRMKEEEMLREKEQKEKEKAYLLRQKEIKENIDEMKRQKEREDEIERMRYLADQLEQDHLRKAELREKRIQSTKKTLAQAEEKREMKKMEEFALSERNKFISLKKQAVESNVPRDPSRLFQPTKGWANRLKENEEANSVANSSFAVQKIPQRAIPAWRTNIR